MPHPETWNPFTDWKPVKIDWVKADVSREDMLRFTRRSNVKGLCYAVGFLLLIAASGASAWWAFSQQYWLLMALALYIHGIFYLHFNDALHELIHYTVFSSRTLSDFFITLYGVLYWPRNPHLYRISHQNYHHRYTLYQGSDGEDTPNYVEFTPKLFVELFLGVFQVRQLLWNIGRLLTLKPTSRTWRGRGYKLDLWEQFILKNAGEKDRRQIYRHAVYALVFQVVFVAVCLYFGLWFLVVLVTLAPFYGAPIHSFLCGTHQHTACEPNHPDFRVSCGTVKLDPFSSFLYWHMEYHTEHHMFAAIPCYNLKTFRRFIDDQMPPRQHTLPRLWKLHKQCREKYGNWQYWRDNFGRYKGF